jgi:hypothetical protein
MVKQCEVALFCKLTKGTLVLPCSHLHKAPSFLSMTKHYLHAFCKFSKYYWHALCKLIKFIK